MEEAKENHSQTPNRIMLQLTIIILLPQTIVLSRTPLHRRPMLNTIVLTSIVPSLIPPPPPHIRPFPPRPHPFQSSDVYPRRPRWMVQHGRSIGHVTVEGREGSRRVSIAV
ncbi:hypothetical protein BDZ85DRAFT_135308 [Elsinoe ampelina]|uniref:Uncharacterized protein n=1 Tax=Elsinoe ampelina TaxID=302913 RepID=A0A6A6G8G3_9PEZI|nr:hypothetical protein BDZ85DRAFT_135308 [Elsinoe ampelina]